MRRSSSTRSKQTSRSNDGENKEMMVRPTKERKGSSICSSIFKHADGVDLWLMAFGFLGAVGDGLSTPILLLITSKIMNDLGQGPTDDPLSFRRHINQSALNFVYLACGSWVVSFLEGYCWTRTGERQAARTRARYLKAVLRQDVGYFDMQVASTSEVVTSVSSDTLIIQDALSEKVPNLIMNAATFVGSYCAAFLLLWRMAAVAFPFATLLVIPGLMYGRTLMNLARKIRQEYSKAGFIAEQAISSIRTVYSFVGEAKTMSDFSTALQGSVVLGLKQGLAKGLAIGSNGITFAIWSFMSWYGSRLVIFHGCQGGTVFAAGASITVGGLALGSGLSNVKCLSEACSAAERIMEVIIRVPKIDSDNMDGKILEQVAGEAEFRNVKFSYPSRPDNVVFREFSLKVPAGKTVALVGGSGSGKSTAIALLERFYEPTSGEITLDGVEIGRLQLKWLRAQLGLVSQEPALFATSVRENILFGKEDANMDEVVAAAKAANAHHFIAQLPQGYDTQVGEKGVKLSGGQKQRIAIARAIIKSPKILLLDEATSALDSQSERTVQVALDTAAVGRTTIVIAHRLSTIRDADLIAVIQNGQVTETGSHDHLICDPGGLYTSLVTLQQITNTELPPGHEQNNSIGHDSGSFSNRYSSSSDNYLSISAGPIPNKEDHEITNAKLYEDERALPVPSFWRLMLLNRPEWKHACLGCLSAISSGAVQPVYAYTLGSMVSVYFLTDHEEIKNKTRTYSIMFFGLFVFSFVLNIMQHYNFAAMGEYLTKRVRERMLSKMLTFEVSWFDQPENSTGAICSRLANANVVRSLVGDRMALLVQTFSAVVIACTMGLVIAWRLALVIIAIQPLIILCFYARKVLLKNMSNKAIKAQDESSKLAAEAVSNLRTVTAFSSQAWLLRMFDRAQDGPRRESIQQCWFAGVGLGTSQCLSTCTWALNFWFGGKLVSQGYITAKALLQTFTILLSTGRVIADAGSMTSDLAKGAEAVGTVFAVLDRYTRIEPDDPDGHRPMELVGSVELKDVDFAYPARPGVMVFKGFSLDIEAGKSTALVGPSGSGKSTVIALIERFYDPLMGTVKIDGYDIRSYHLISLRKHIALVSQEPTLFGGTIWDNIAYGCGDDGPHKVSASEIIEAARAAGAHDFVNSLKNGYDTWCGERGVQLSGGQKQRIAIARALVKKPAILLLDEATSALDSQSEQLVQEALERVMVGRTSVVVAHCLTTIRNCHLIAVLQNGALVEKGTHESLMAKGPGGSYFSLVALQQRPEADTPQNT